VIVARRAAVVAVALVLSACGSSAPPQPSTSQAAATAAPSSTLAPSPSAAMAPPAAVPGTSFAMALPWPSTGTDGKPLSHPWTGGPHAFYKGSDCLPADACATDVPASIRSGLDFGTGGGPDWDVYAVGAGILVYKGPLPGGFGAGAITQHGDLFVVYAHMAEASLGSAPAVGTTVDRGTKLGSTWCTGMVPCNAASGNHHLHLELRSGLSVAGTTVTYDNNVTWDSRTVGGWAIKAGALNYNGTATACGTTITADVAGPAIYDASTCGAPVTPPTVVSGTWVAPKDGATLTTSALTLSAKPTSSDPATPVSTIVYTVSWSGGRKKACTATGSGGVWSCTADLLALGVPPGKVSITFDVTAGSLPSASSPAGTRSITYAVLPPKPAGTTYKNVSQTMNASGTELENVDRLMWTEPAGYATGFRIYGIDVCYGRKAGDPCIGLGMKIPPKDLQLLGTVPGTARSFLVKYPTYFEGGGPASILVSAFNAYGESRLTIGMTLTCVDAAVHPNFCVN
jgi:murein DD-endopeptidase MepM/ murein hydrolase activator NlpD